jgi:hypothetical protein
MLTLAWFANSWPVYAMAGSVPAIKTNAAELARPNLKIFIVVSIFRVRGNPRLSLHAKWAPGIVVQGTIC